MITEQPTTGTLDDDDPNDEHAGENEAPVREINELTEAPEEMQIDDEDDDDERDDEDDDDDDN